MGVMISTYPAPHLWRENEPDCEAPIKYDPLLGFKNGRKIRKMIATEEEMDSAGLDSEERDYCAHILIKSYACHNHEFPFINRCAGILHEWQNCQFKDYQHDMKEFERERRLMERESRLRKKASREMAI